MDVIVKIVARVLEYLLKEAGEWWNAPNDKRKANDLLMDVFREMVALSPNLDRAASLLDEARSLLERVDSRPLKATLRTRESQIRKLRGRVPPHVMLKTAADNLRSLTSPETGGTAAEVGRDFDLEEREMILEMLTSFFEGQEIQHFEPPRRIAGYLTRDQIMNALVELRAIDPSGESDSFAKHREVLQVSLARVHARFFRNDDCGDLESDSRVFEEFLEELENSLSRSAGGQEQPADTDEWFARLCEAMVIVVDECPHGHQVVHYMLLIARRDQLECLPSALLGYLEEYRSKSSQSRQDDAGGQLW